MERTRECRRRNCPTQDAAHRLRDRRRITSSRPRRPAPIWRATMACATACACRAARSAEMYRNTRERGFGAEVKRRIMLGTYALSSGYYDAYYLRRKSSQLAGRPRLRRCVPKVDAILTPTAPTASLQTGRKVGGPAEDVSGGHLSPLPDRSRAFRGSPFPAAKPTRVSHRHADLRPAFQREHRPPNRSCVRTGQRFRILRAVQRRPF